MKKKLFAVLLVFACFMNLSWPVLAAEIPDSTAEIPRETFLGEGKWPISFSPEGAYLLSGEETAARVLEVPVSSSTSNFKKNMNIQGFAAASMPAADASLIKTSTVDSFWRGNTVVSGNLPGFNDNATQENVLALLDQYDPDGAFILRKAGENFLRWFSSGTLLRCVGTAVHEEYHSMSFDVAFSQMDFGGAQKDVYYAGNGILLPVTMTKVYNSKEMIPYIPADLQNTMRFDTYVNTNEANLGSVKNGVYGLMNEFNAYGCGLNNAVNLYEYYKNNAKEVNDWFQYVNIGANDRLAYAEFRYYMLTYLLYAKDNYPDIYQSIIGNQSFKNAFKQVDDWFAGNIKRYEDTLSDLQQNLNRAGHKVQIENDWFWVDGSGTGIFGSDYQKLMNAMSAEMYQNELIVLKS